VATRGQQDDTVEMPRLSKLENVVAATTPPAAEHEVRRIDEPSVTFAPPGTDGHVILVTRERQVVTTCHDVYRFAFPPQFLDQVQSLIEAGDVRGLLEFQPHTPAPIAQRLGQPVWDRDSSAQIQPFPDLTQAWITSGDGTSSMVVTFARTGDPRLGQPELHTQRSAMIASLLSLVNPSLRREVPTTQALDPCPAVTFGFVQLQPVRTVARVVFMRGDIVVPPQQIIHLVGDLQVEFADDKIVATARSFDAVRAAVTAAGISFARVEQAGPAEATGRGVRADRLKSLRDSAWKPFLQSATPSASASMSPQDTLLNSPTPVDEVIRLRIS
jgi:hypothetical protein